jgi:hypothetical protein
MIMGSWSDVPRLTMDLPQKHGNTELSTLNSTQKKIQIWRFFILVLFAYKCLIYISTTLKVQ